MTYHSEALGRYANGVGLVLYDGFQVLKESITRSKNQLEAISALTPIQKQFIATLVDTEVAVGYFLKLRNERRAWTAYLAVKMKYRGDLAYLAELIAHHPPSRSLNANTITHALDLRWSVMAQGVVAYTLLRDIRTYLRNEKSIVEVDCILRHGPILPFDVPHPFVECGAKPMRRGVWRWPQIDDEPTVDRLSTAPK
ncbi:MAG TPA: hypothetical protein VGR53_05165 [Nitrososphaerales archaeon]|nr:hypothetical protein [Nitrososphaerales archaeon]